MEKPTKKTISIRAAIGAVVFAIGLWIYANLNGSFITFASLPLEIQLPEGKAVESPLPSYLVAKVKGDGWTLLNALYLRAVNACRIDYSQATFVRDSAMISRSDLLKAIQLNGNIEVLDVFPEYLPLSIGEISEKTVPIFANVKVKLRDGFMLIGEVETNPKEVTIRGSKKALQKIDSWQTDPVVISDAYSSFNQQVQLAENNNNLISPLTKTISISGKIDQIAEITFYDVPVVLEGAPEGYKLDFSPPFVETTLRGGAAELSQIDPTNLSVKINYSSIANDSNGYYAPRMEPPANCYLLKIYPQFITRSPFKIKPARSANNGVNYDKKHPTN